MNAPADTPTTDRRPLSFDLTAAEADSVKLYAAAGLAPDKIAMAMGWPREKRTRFRLLSMIPGSALADLIAEGKASASMKTLMALSEAAADGDVEAVKALAEIRERNRFDRLLNYMDEDELAL